MKLIVTHPGRAHKDDFLAVALLLARARVPVERREPRESDLEDAEVAVVDVGGRHEPELLNFDHHQFDRDVTPLCAISLVLQHYGLYEAAKRFCDWLTFAEWMDVRGPNVTAGWLGVTREQMARLNSPIDVTLINRFARSESLQPGEVLHEVIGWLGEELIEFLENAKLRSAWVAEHAEHWTLKGKGNAVIEVLFLPRGEDNLEDASGAMAQWVRENDMGGLMHVLVYPDRRGTGYGLARYEDHPAVDFRRVEGAEGVHFVHASGFLCKTTHTDEQRLKEIIQMAFQPSE